MGQVYIVYSQSLDKYYTGVTQDSVVLRLEKHNKGVYGKRKYTSTANDWKLYLTLSCDDYNHAIRLERKIKSMKSRKYIENLEKYEEIREKIINETKST